MNVKAKATVHNKFEVRVVDAATGRTKQEAVAYNVITDQFFKMRLGLLGNYPAMSNAMGYIGFGSGNGTPAVTDTALFSLLDYKASTVVEQVYEYPTSRVTRQVKLNADEYNGSTITEVGLAAFYNSKNYALMTHAMLQDAEGNPIAIQKTDMDVVYITATFFVTFSPTGFGDHGVYPKPEKNGLLAWLMFGTLAYTVYTDRSAISTSDQLSSEYLFSKAYSFADGKGDFDTLTYELPLITILDGEWNGHIVKNIGVPGIGAFQFPDASVFPDYEVSHLVVGEGDGAATEFNVQCPLIKEGTMRVFVGGTELAAEEFEADYESNCSDCRENYYTANMTAQMENVSFGDVESRSPYSGRLYHDPLRWMPFPLTGQSSIYPQYCSVTQDKPIWLDFGEAKACNRLRIDNNTINASYVDKLVIECSEDNENWEALAYTREEEAYSSSITYYTFRFPLTAARYWRVYIPGYSWTYYFYYNNNIGTREGVSHIHSTFFLGKCVPGLTLKTPPASGETVEVSYKLDVPYKTENNILRMTCTIALQRGVTSGADNL